MRFVGFAAIGLAASALLIACQSARTGSAPAGSEPGTPGHRDAVMTSRFCAGCHPAFYAEHRQNTHGLAFFDEEARLATRGFRREDCVRCHTPRPVFETGIGMTPMQRWHDLEEGNTCMSCHGKEGYDYSRFEGGDECRGAFDPRVGTVQHCATCHRIAGTPDQWSRAEHGSLAGKLCIGCHMPLVTRPVAVGRPARPVRSHLFPASSSEAQLRRAYAYDARIEGSEVVVRITNKGAGHNFPTANRQRAVESLIVVRDRDGGEVARSRLTCRYPYASELAPHQLTPPVSSQIPSGKTSEHRIPLTVAEGTVECRMYFKLYRPVADTDPRLSRCLEERRLPFAGITPSTQAVPESPEVAYPAPGTSLNDFFDPSGLTNVARPAPTSRPVVPEGRDQAEIDALAGMLEWHQPEARKLARERLAAIYPASAGALVSALGRWSNETFTEAQRTFLAIGSAAVPALTEALRSDQLYVRCHARDLLAQIDVGSERPRVLAELRRGLAMTSPLDRRSTAQALGELHDADAVPQLRPLVDDGDWDVVHAACVSLGHLGDRDAVPAIERVLRVARWPETRRALAQALAGLGSSAGVQPLIDDLDDDDPLQREYTFSALFAITGRHFGYEPSAPTAERMKAQSRIQAWWAQDGGNAAVRPAPHVDRWKHEQSWLLVEELGGGTDTRQGGNDEVIVAELLARGADAVPALIEGLTFPSGFAEKRALLCRVLGQLGSKEAAPYLGAALRDPVPAVTEWACWALESCGDAESLTQLSSYQDRIPALLAADRGAGSDAPADGPLARAARTRLTLGDARARRDLVNLLLSPNVAARRIAIGALRDRFGEDRGYDPDAAEAERRDAALRWQEQ